MDALAAAMPHIAHVHVADLEGRAAPGESGSSDYRPFFRTLKKAATTGCAASSAARWTSKPAARPS